MGDGADITFGMLTGAGFGRGVADADADAGAGVADALDAGAGVGTAVGRGTGVFATGAGVGSFLGCGIADEFDGFVGRTGDSCFVAAGCGAGDAFREGGADIGTGEACLIGGENIGCVLDKAEGGGELALPDMLGLLNLRDNLGFGGAGTLGAGTREGTTGAGND